jgi:hypothetical protein
VAKTWVNPRKLTDDDVRKVLTKNREMSAFFHGWRRKLGCITLIVALTFAAPWIRSYQLRDRFAFWIGTRYHHLYSFQGRIVWDAITPDAVVGTWSWNTRQIRGDADISEPNFPLDPHDRWKVRRWNLQYLPLVLPLALLSGYLILWRSPQPSKPPTVNTHE